MRAPRSAWRGRRGTRRRTLAPRAQLERLPETSLDAGGRVDDLVAVHLTPAALDLVLRPERQLSERTGDLT